MSAHDTTSATARGAQIRGPIEFPKYVTVAGKPELVQDAEHEAKLLAANSATSHISDDGGLAPAGESASDNAQQPVRTPLGEPSIAASAKPHVLMPFDLDEALTIREAARIAGRRPVTVRGWAANYDIGRRVCGRWMVSRVALAMHLDNDRNALKAYLAGDRESETVTGYFRRFGLDPRKI